MRALGRNKFIKYFESFYIFLVVTSFVQVGKKFLDPIRKSKLFFEKYFLDHPPENF
jgi:hypothetical protein